MQDGDNPFSNLPMFAEMAKALAGQGPLNWEVARQFADLSATGTAGGVMSMVTGAGGPTVAEPNVDPAVRVRLTELARIVELHVADLTGADAPFPEPQAVTRTVWARRALDDYRPLFTELATSLGRRDDDPDTTDPMATMMAGLSKMMAPAMMGMAIGSMVGRMASRAFSQYDLPIPRPSRDVVVVPTNIDAFADDWQVPVDEMRLWVLAQELTAHALFGAATLRDDLTALVRRHVAGFRPDPSALADRLGTLDAEDGDPMSAIGALFGDPAVLLGAVRSPEQDALAPTLDAALAAVVGYVDYVVDGVAVRVIGGDALRIAEAVRRRRLESSPDDLFVERLLGIRLTAAQVQRGKEFVAGVVDRIGESRLATLFTRPDALPTPAEVEAPGLWIARLEL